MPAGEEDYDGVPYEDMVFEDIDWSDVGDHDPGRRSERKGAPNERNVPVEWATEACQDPDRLVRSAGSTTGYTVRITGRSTSAGFIVTVILAPRDLPPDRRWKGVTAWATKPSEIKRYLEEQ